MKAFRKELKYKGDVLFINHHMAHAASAFLVSPFKEAAIVTIDGVGEWSTTTYGYGKDIEIHLTKEIRFPSSIGLLYSTITAYLGFSVNNSEYKVMGLAAYGNMNSKTNPYYKKLLKVIDIKKDGSYQLDMNYFSFHYGERMPHERLCKLLGAPACKKDSEMRQREKDIAAALQLITEEVMTKILTHVYKETKIPRVVLAGGVALNSVYNGKILSRTPFKELWIQPNASDGGTSIGAAAYVYHTLLGKTRNASQRNAYLGPEFTDNQIETFFKENNIVYSKFKSEEGLLKTTAKYLRDNVVIGWFQKGME